MTNKLASDWTLASVLMFLIGWFLYLELSSHHYLSSVPMNSRSQQRRCAIIESAIKLTVRLQTKRLNAEMNVVFKITGHFSLGHV